MKLVIQIPACNEEQQLGKTLGDLPRTVVGFDQVEHLVFDDGSDDATAELARAAGAEVVRLPVHRGLAVAFAAGLAHAVESGADVIVNTDADNQYDARDIPALVRPILEGDAQMVIGDRQVHTLRHFSFSKRALQKLGSWVVRKISRTSVRDATSGFRAISRAAALKLHVFTRFTYTLETILQAGEAGLKVVSVPIRVNAEAQRPSRLFASNTSYVLRSLESIARIVVLYNPLRMFLRIGSIPVLVGLALLLRFLYFYVIGDSPAGHIQSLILAAILLIIGFQTMLIGLLSDLIGANRKILEEVLYQLKKMGLEDK